MASLPKPLPDQGIEIPGRVFQVPSVRLCYFTVLLLMDPVVLT